MTFRKIVVIIVFTLIIITISSFYIFYQNSNNKELEETFVNLIIEIDSYILTEHLDHAEKLIFTASEFAKSPLEFKRLLKRAFNIHSYKYLELISEMAYQEYPKDIQILSIYVFALLRDGKSTAAAAILDFNKKEISNNLYTETKINIGNYDSNENIFYRALNEKNVSVFKKLYELTNNNKFLIDAALISLVKGNFELAETIFTGVSIDYLEYQKLLFLIKYDSGKLDSALELLNTYDCGFSIQEIQLFRIDIQIRQGLYRKAQIAIIDFINIYPEYSWVPYYNFIWLNSVNIIIDPKRIIEEGLKIYPNNRKLMLIVTDYYIENKMDIVAAKILEEYINNNESDDELEIILNKLKGPKDPGYVVNRVRSLVNQNPGNINASRYLAWNIFVNNDIPHLQYYLDQIEGEEAAGWIKFFRAIIYAVNREYILSMEEFESSYELELQWETLFNLAVLSEYTNNFQDAIEYYQKAENSLANKEVNAITKSMIRTALATLLYEIKDYDHSYRELRKALDLDTYNLKANLMLKKLESVTF